MKYKEIILKRDHDDLSSDCPFCNNDYAEYEDYVEIVAFECKSVVYYSKCCEIYFRVRYYPRKTATKDKSIQTVLFK